MGDGGARGASRGSVAESTSAYARYSLFRSASLQRAWRHCVGVRGRGRAVSRRAPRPAAGCLAATIGASSLHWLLLSMHERRLDNRSRVRVYCIILVTMKAIFAGHNPLRRSIENS